MNRRFLFALAALVLPSLPGCGDTLEGEVETGVVRVALTDPSQACVDPGDGSPLRPPNRLATVEFQFMMGQTMQRTLVWDQAELVAQCAGSAPTIDTLPLLPGNYDAEIVLRDSNFVRLNGNIAVNYPTQNADVIRGVPVRRGIPVDLTFLASAATGDVTVDAGWNGLDFELAGAGPGPLP